MTWNIFSNAYLPLHIFLVRCLQAFGIFLDRIFVFLFLTLGILYISYITAIYQIYLLQTYFFQSVAYLLFLLKLSFTEQNFFLNCNEFQVIIYFFL